MNFHKCFLILIITLSAASFADIFAEERVHIVERGETIFSIARSFSVDRDELMKVNGITDPTRLQAGQRLRIPDDSAVMAAGNSFSEFLYQAVRGDTFYSIARKHDVTVNEILAANSLSADYVLKQGDVLVIPGISGPFVAAINPVSASSALAAAPAVQTNQASAVTSTLTGTAVPAANTAAGTNTRAAETAAIDASVRWPVTANELSYLSGKNSGVIITGQKSEPVKSLSSGTVISAGPYRGYGRIAIVQSDGGYFYVYGGCETLTVREGDKVGPGMEMGRLGIDPITEKPQLFFRVYLNNTPIDPAKAPRT